MSQIKTYKNVGVIGKLDGTHLPDPLTVLTDLLQQRGLKVLMDERTASFSRSAPDHVVTLEALGKQVDSNQRHSMRRHQSRRREQRPIAAHRYGQINLLTESLECDNMIRRASGK